MTNTTLTHDTAGNGGGLLNVNGTSNAMATINGSSFTFDTSSNGYGGGIYNAATLAVGSSHFSNDSAGFGGGGLFNNGMTTLATVDFTSDSTGGYGGGILSSPVAGNVNYKQVTFSGNQAAQSPDVFGLLTPLP